ncbi:uncharacterized protein BX663DRAFT_519681 [Cokeromyces recurvatus]|uniref:uncharacterized protein n=1 Tax=Cokeromyces recurvatus TaxID=90255 RepID=UPI00221E8386|nr:uncharacterized protein BX663DRAFT_519681 [Cokeromyces recurvatus]KAI7899844.1 hypothetical protein BX663DRAFT_519681 [Cokeromyces recurvatus]
MASTTKEQETKALFTDLNKAIDNYNDELCLEICEKLIKLNPNDQLALQCKVVSLIRLEKYKDALTIIARQFKNSDIDLSYEKIYCYYRTNQLMPAMELLNELKSKQKNVDPSLSYLEAQLLYSQGQFEKAVEVYESLLKSTGKNNHLHDEIQVNLLAAKAGLLFSNKEVVKDDFNVQESADLYEVAYNAASVYLARGDIKKAQEQLELAYKQCSDRSQGMSKEEQDEELAVISTQLGYTYQLQGRINDAMKIYKQLLNSSDVTVAAVVSNNMVAIDQNKDLEDATKKLKIATTKEADAKLKNYQKRIISMNDTLLQLYNQKYSACRDQAQKLIEKYPDNDSLYLILASATYHQHKADKAIEELKKYAERKPSSVAIRFATIQLQLLESQPASALVTLQSYLDTLKEDKQRYYQPGLIALLVWLYEQTGQSVKAIETLDQASDVWKNDSSFKNTTAPTSTIKQAAVFKLKTGRFQEAVADYEQLVKADPSDAQAIAGLIAAYAEVDPQKAEQYGNALPSVALGHLDIETLETIVPGVKRGYIRKDPHAPHVPKPRMKKKKAPIYPKNMDPQTKPDPERWLPKYERSTFRMKGKNKKALNKGPQGVSLEGGGIGGTGSANIGGNKKIPEPIKEKISTSMPSKNKKKKGKGRR